MKNLISASCKSKLTGYCLNVVSVMLVAVKELSALHDKHLNRPTLDDSVDEETAIEVRTQEITQVPLTTTFPHWSSLLCHLLYYSTIVEQTIIII